MPLEAVRDTVLVEIIYNEMIGEVYVPDESKQYHADTKSLVIFVGPEYPYRADLKKGDIIFQKRLEGFKVFSNLKEYLSLQEKWVVAKEGGEYGVLPLGDRVLIAPEKKKETTDSGIYIASEEEEESQEATILEVGKDVQSLNKGDKVIYGELWMTEIRLNEKRFLVFKQENIMGVKK